MSSEKTKTELDKLNKQIVFRTNSDSKSIVFISKSPSASSKSPIIYASAGRYGGYILKLSDLFPDQNISNVSVDDVKRVLEEYKVYFVEPRIEVIDKYKIDREQFLRQNNIYDLFMQLPDEMKKMLIENVDSIEDITYSYTEIDYEVKKVSEGYIVLDLKPKQNPQRLYGKALRFSYIIPGSRRHPRGHLGQRIVDELRFKYPENDVIQSYLYSTSKRDDRDAVIYLKIPVDVPNFFEIEKEEVEEEEPTAVEPEEESKPEEIPPIEIKPKLRLRLRLPEEVEERVEVKEEKPSKPEKSELVKIYLLSMRLPSKYLVQKVYYEKNKEIREFNDVSGKLETIRREAYSMITRAFAYVEEYGTWIAVSDDAVKEAYNVSEYVIKRLKELNLHDKVDRYIVKAIPIYLDPLDARELLDATVKHLSQDIDELARKIDDAEKENKRNALKRLEREKRYKEKLLEAFKKYLSEISRGEAGG